MCGPRLEQEDLGQDDLVIEHFELLEQLLGLVQRRLVASRVELAARCQRRRVLVRINVQSDELDLQALPEEHALLVSSPIDAVLGNAHLSVAGRRWVEVDQRADWQCQHSSQILANTH
jgi:hypothetical protein